MHSYTMGQRGEERLKRTQSIFVDDLKIYQKLKIVNFKKLIKNSK